MDIQRPGHRDTPALPQNRTPGRRGTTHRGHTLPSSGEGLAGVPYPASPTGRKKGFFLPKTDWVCLQQEISEQGKRVKGQLRAPTPEHPQHPPLQFGPVTGSFLAGWP